MLMLAIVVVVVIMLFFCCWLVITSIIQFSSFLPIYTISTQIGNEYVVSHTNRFYAIYFTLVNIEDFPSLLLLFVFFSLSIDRIFTPSYVCVCLSGGVELWGLWSVCLWYMLLEWHLIFFCNVCGWEKNNGFCTLLCRSVFHFVEVITWNFQFRIKLLQSVHSIYPPPSSCLDTIFVNPFQNSTADIIPSQITWRHILISYCI